MRGNEHAGDSSAGKSGYKGLRDYDRDLTFVDMTVRDMADLMEARATFAVMASFADCPWCNAVIDNINDADNILHLYVPHIFYIKEGEVVHDYQGALPEMGSGPIYFEKGDGEITSIQLINPDTGKPTDKTTIPAYDSKTGKRCGTYTLVTADPKTGKRLLSRRS